MSKEQERLDDRRGGSVLLWERWGPYVAERAWGTVREDYSANGDAWSYFTHDDARKRAFRRGEDGIAGICDRFQVLVFAPAFWNGKDPILKERLFGLNSHEGNHGEDVKEIYYYLDATPTGSYLKYLYKYPQEEFPYDRLVEENQKRRAKDREFEIIDTGIFDEDRYFDVFIEYAKVDPDDLCIRIEAFNRGPDPAPFHLIPQLWFRNQWAWGPERIAAPAIEVLEEEKSHVCLMADDSNISSPHYLLFDYHLGKRYFYGPAGGTPLFTDNDSNQEALFGVPNQTSYVKDAFHRTLIQKEKGAVNPNRVGTKAALHYSIPSVPPGESVVLKFRLTNRLMKDPLKDVDDWISERKNEADEFYKTVHPAQATEEEKQIQRQAFAGMIWNKQIYIFAIGNWLEGDNPKFPPPPSHKKIRNIHWRHLVSMRIMSMPDKWEYPWFAAWDLAFHSVVFGLIDLEFAKSQLWMLFQDQFQHPNGEIPAYEWEFSDVNPPVQGWALLKLFEYEKKKFGREDFDFLEKCFHKLLLNFAWWVNRVDQFGNNVFEGGFLGMDNISFLDRSQKGLPGHLIDQADGAGWMSLLCLNMMRIALLLSKKNRNYECLGIKFFQHFIYVTAAMRKGYWRQYDLWNEEESFFQSYLRYPNGESIPIKSRSLVSLIPFFATDVWDEEELKQYPEFYSAYQWMLEKKPELTNICVKHIPHTSSNCCKHLFGLLSVDELSRFLRHLWDPNEFRSDYGLRSVSKCHEAHPAEFMGIKLRYEPGEALEKIKGGNSNWRGPIWFPINIFLIDTLSNLSVALEDQVKVEVKGQSTASVGNMAQYYAEALLKLMTKNHEGHRPIFGDYEKFQTDPHFRDYLFFYEHFHGDNGRGLGASHQNGWTGLIANVIDFLRK